MNDLIIKNNKSISIKRATTDSDFLIIRDLAYEIWPETYESIISKVQIDLLLNKYFALKNLKQFILEGYEYYLIEHNLKNIGFISFVDRGDYVYIDKIYLLKDFRSQGIAKAFIKKLLNSSKKPLKLNVNQKNSNAINAYFKLGFVIEKEEVIKLNDKLSNVDFVMILNFK